MSLFTMRLPLNFGSDWLFDGSLISDHWKIGWVSILIIFLYNTKNYHFLLFTRSNKMALFYCRVIVVQENDRVYVL